MEADALTTIGLIPDADSRTTAGLVIVWEVVAEVTMRNVVILWP